LGRRNTFIKTQREQANYIVVSSQIAEAIDNLDIKRLRKKKLLKILESIK
jgi:hypothetical protein